MNDGCCPNCGAKKLRAGANVDAQGSYGTTEYYYDCLECGATITTDEIILGGVEHGNI